MSYARYVAIGDSQTEGLLDGDEISGYRGWADRLAGQLAAASPGLLYANLAVRGRLAAQVRDTQLGPALELRPDLATVVAGMNDLIRPRFSAAEVTACLEDMFAALTAAGTRVATLTFPDASKIMPIARPLLPRVLDLNARIRDAAARHDVTVLDGFAYAVTTDLRLWSPDRLHLSPLGHAAWPPPWRMLSERPAATAPGPSRCPRNPPALRGRPLPSNCAGWPPRPPPGHTATHAAAPPATDAPPNALPSPPSPAPKPPAPPADLRTQLDSPSAAHPRKPLTSPHRGSPSWAGPGTGRRRSAGPPPLP